MSMKADQRVQLTIPYPSHIPRARGIHAVNRFSGYCRVDMSTFDIETIDEAAALVGITRSAFIRWVAVQSAKEIINGSQPVPEPTQAEP